MPTTTTYDQTVHFDPWTDENDYFDIGDDVPDHICPNGANDDDGDDRHIKAWSTNKSQLKTYIDGLIATGNTSTDIGVKWGAALLDPSTQSVLDSMISSDDVVDLFANTNGLTFVVFECMLLMRSVSLIVQLCDGFWLLKI